MAEVAFSLSKDEFSQPTQSSLGWHVIRVVDIENKRQKTLDEVRDELKAEIANEKAIDSLYEIANRLEDELGGGATFEEAAANVDLELIKIDSIDRTGRDADGNLVLNLPREGGFLDIAFSTPENSESNLSESGANGYFIIRVDSVTPPALRPLETVIEDVTAAWETEQRAKAASAKAEALMNRIRDGLAASAIAREAGLEITTSSPFTRSGEGADEGLPKELIRNIFSIKQGEATMARGADSSYVAWLKEVQAADPYADEDGRKAIEGQLTKSVRGDLQAQLAQALRDRFPVSINQRAIDQNF